MVCQERVFSQAGGFRQYLVRVTGTISFLALVPLTLQGCSWSQQARGSLRQEQLPSDQIVGTERAGAGGGRLAAASHGPNLVLDKTTFDFGKVKTGSTNTAVFRLSNSGDSPLDITDVQKCCGAIIKLDKSRLAPQENTVLTAEYRAMQGAGQLLKKIGIVTNDPMKPRVELTITGDIVATLAWAPVQFKIALNGDRTQCPDITIKSLDGKVFSIEGFAATGQAITARFDPNQKDTAFTLRPIVDLARLKALPTSTCSVLVNLDHPDYKTVSVPFEVVQPLQVTPLQLLVFNVKAGEPVAKVVQIQDSQMDPNTAASIAVESVVAQNGSRVELRGVTPRKAGCDLNLEIWPAKANENEAFSSDQLVVKLKDGRELTVPLRAFYQSPAVSSAATPKSNP